VLVDAIIRLHYFHDLFLPFLYVVMPVFNVKFYPYFLALLLSSPLRRVFTIICLKQPIFPGYIVLQVFFIYNLCYM